ncbi:1-acyl-sn-glycerol-3-phosphate acyltransferase, partial [Candidatus Ruminimicrobium bovinum]|uniref:1-acyl-sn-glycerol-3-phosphate acyltransferase n=1 Tax=Candidatus Ruminimicrobium bovinum TaxID=3242779 RepID=UPI0039B92558
MINAIIKVLLNKKLIVALSKLFLRVQVKGLDEIKNLQGKVLFIANHNSFIDTFLLWAFIPENLCFTINPIIAKKWYIKPLLNITKFFKIEPNKPMAVKSIIKEINSGQKLVIYPEGRVTSTGNMMKIYPGPAVIADKTDAYIVPIHIDGTQYTTFSYYGNKVKIKPKIKVVVNIFKPTKLNVDENLKG